jgi:thiol-disulfide isomerase/thioredoxin
MCRERVVTVLLLVLGLTALPACSGRETERVGDDGLRSLRLQRLHGPGDVSFTDFAGTIVLVDFWATWCTPCYRQAEILEELHREFAGRGVEFLAVSVGEPADVVEQFVRERPFSYPVLIDPEDLTTTELGVYALPTVLILDRQGEIAYFEPGLSKASTLRRVLNRLGT